MRRPRFWQRGLPRRLERLEDRRLLAGVFQFSASSYYVGENGGTALVTVSRTGSTAGTSTVQYSTSNGSATAGSDYSTTNGTLTFTPGQASQPFFVPTLVDAAPDGNETVNLTLSNPTGGASLGSPTAAVLTILDSSIGFAETQLTNQLNSPVTMAVAPDGRIFVAQQAGAIRVIKNGALLAAPFGTVGTVADDEEGLVGVTFDPNFASNGFVYVAYTVVAPTRHNVIARLTANGDVMVPGSEVRLFDLDDNIAHYHVGGALHFGGDGKLYMSTGDNANGGNSSQIANTHGKILRINPDGTIPTDNPFYNTATGRNRAIWALGLRNAFTFDVQPGTGRVFISEVGGGNWEEVNDGIAGSNYGWPAAEGPVGTPPSVTFGTYRNPIHSYQHGSDGFAITGAAFYNPPSGAFHPGYVGKFFYTEYVLNKIRWIDPAHPNTYTTFRTSAIAGPVDVRVGPDGSLYYLARGNSDLGGGPNVPGGSVFKITFTGSQAPSITLPPASQTVSSGQTAMFSVVAGGTPPLSYQWQRNSVNISGATNSSYTTPATSMADNGAQYRVIVSNSFGTITSTAATLTVTANQPPMPTILLPTAGSMFAYGDLLSFSGSATDPENGTLPASAFRWQIDYFTGGAQRPGMPSTTGITSGSYSISTVSPYKGSDVFFRVYLTVTDFGGISATVTRDVIPEVVTVILATNIPGLSLTLDGSAVPSGHTFAGVTGLEREIGAMGVQKLAGISYHFASWSNGGPGVQTISTPVVNTTYTASYQGILGQTVTLADWYGDYASTDTAMQRYSQPVESGLTLDGVGSANDHRWYLPFSDTAPINPNPGGGNAYGGTYNQNNSWRFYGGLLFHSYNASFSTRWAEVWANAPGSPQHDNLYVHAGSSTATDGWELLYWKKQDFLNYAWTGIVQFSPTSELRIEDYLGSDGFPTENSGRLRFVVRDGTQFYISEDFAGPAGSGADLVLTDPNSRRWAVYQPAAPYALKFDVAAASFAPHYFVDVTAVGVYHSNDNSTASNRHAGVNFARFSVTGALAITPSQPPVAEYPLDSSGIDLRGGDQNLTLTGSPTFTSGRIGNAILLNGTTQFGATTTAVLNTQNSYSISAMVYWDGAAGARTIVGQDGVNVSAFRLQKTSGNRFALVLPHFDSTGGGQTVVQWNTAPVANRWYHLVGVYDAVLGEARLYVDGWRVASAAFTSAVVSFGPLTVGRARSLGNVEFWKGRIDQVEVYPRALGDSEVAFVRRDGLDSIAGAAAIAEPPPGDTTEFAALRLRPNPQVVDLLLGTSELGLRTVDAEAFAPTIIRFDANDFSHRFRRSSRALQRRSTATTEAIDAALRETLLDEPLDARVAMRSSLRWPGTRPESR